MAVEEERRAWPTLAVTLHLSKRKTVVEKRKVPPDASEAWLRLEVRVMRLRVALRAMAHCERQHPEHMPSITKPKRWSVTHGLAVFDHHDRLTLALRRMIDPTW